MPENIVGILDQIVAVRGPEYAQGLVDMANMLKPPADEDEDEE